MYFDFQLSSDDDDQWIEGLESIDEEPEMKEAVRIQDPIASLGLVPPLTAEIGTNLKNALKQLQKETVHNCKHSCKKAVNHCKTM